MVHIHIQISHSTGAIQYHTHGRSMRERDFTSIKDKNTPRTHKTRIVSLLKTNP